LCALPASWQAYLPAGRVGLFVTIFFKAEKALKKDEFILSEAEGLQSLTQMLV